LLPVVHPNGPGCATAGAGGGTAILVGLLAGLAVAFFFAVRADFDEAQYLNNFKVFTDCAVIPPSLWLMAYVCVLFRVADMPGMGPAPLSNYLLGMLFAGSLHQALRAFYSLRKTFRALGEHRRTRASAAGIKSQ
jgi:hypothetical protein